MIVITRWRRRHAPAARDYYMPGDHRQEAERLARVIDDVLQSGARRSLSDLIALARLHLDLACAGRAGELRGWPVTFPTGRLAGITCPLTCGSEVSEVIWRCDFRALAGRQGRVPGSAGRNHHRAGAA